MTLEQLVAICTGGQHLIAVPACETVISDADLLTVWFRCPLCDHLEQRPITAGLELAALRLSGAQLVDSEDEARAALPGPPVAVG